MHIHVNSVIAAGPSETAPADGIYIYQGAIDDQRSRRHELAAILGVS